MLEGVTQTHGIVVFRAGLDVAVRPSDIGFRRDCDSAISYRRIIAEAGRDSRSGMPTRSMWTALPLLKQHPTSEGERGLASQMARSNQRRMPENWVDWGEGTNGIRPMTNVIVGGR
ncbi:hypothetical protein K469DRAFT_694721 [Zopfia rhizophila CBS 207.26]|uniref:Uncharacterized protein n=1 Tax=Zopfia rhizophila CBS 207.26 TaxID=1314779 RepID=A0A6A6EKG2_9PEZI|nr:hypothetical protein K469DRAFT_694721 [Zopfia rhizophila CBS 207.26]